MRLARLVSYVWGHQLNCGGRWRALGRVARWQVASRLLPGPIAFPFVDDTQLFAGSGMTGATGNWYCGLHEAEEMGFILHFLRPSDLFIDVGANIGSYTIMAAGGSGARVVSVEPIPDTFAKLQRNVVLNGLAERVELHRVGLSRERSDLRFTPDQDTVNHVMATGELGSAILVPVVSMDELLAGRVPVIIKIDVEGHEQAVLEGARQTLSDQRVAAVVMEINGSSARYGLGDDALFTTMRDYGFKPYAYNPVSRKLRNWVSSTGNVIFIRDDSAATSRVLHAKHHHLINGTI